MNWTNATCAERAFASRGRAVAAIDLGTNNCRLMIAKRRRQGFAVVATFSRIVRLGEGLVSTGSLSTEAMDRTVDALKECAEMLARWDVVTLRAVATEACRSAANGQVFIDRVRAETGLRLDMIGPAEEARLALVSCAPLLHPEARRAILFDIGGGSTEICFLEADGGLPKLHRVVSLPTGVVRVAEEHGGSFTASDYAAVKASVASAVAAQTPPGFAEALCPAADHLIGTSGTATSLAAFKKGLKRYRRKEIDGSWLNAAEIVQVARELDALGEEGRCASPSIGAGRADLIMPGCAILEGILCAAKLGRVRVADRGLREGVVTELLAQRSAERRAGHHGRAAIPAE